MKTRIIFFGVFAMLLAFQSCDYVNKQELLLNTLCDTMNVKYSGHISSTLTDHCITCHNTALPSGGVKLDSYNDVKSQVDNGRLLGSISHAAGYKPMPQGAPKLDPCVIDKIHAWINTGAPNN